MIMETTTIYTTPRAADPASRVTRVGAFRRCAASLRRWLKAEHDFLASDGEPLRLTGAKFVAYNCILAVVALLLCIQF
jgi:hypothetical protein